MRTALVTHGWLDCVIPGYAGPDETCRRMERWLHHYRDCWPTYIIDNGSSLETCNRFASKYPDIGIITLDPHFERKSDLYYPNVWRAYWILKDMLEFTDRIYYIASDAYVCSQRLMDYLESCKSGWTALWSPHYNMPEAQIQVICRCDAVYDFFKGPIDPFKYNGKIEEVTLPFTHVEKGFIGDRFGEFELAIPQHYSRSPIRMPYDASMDYYTQVPDDLDWDDSKFPVVRRDALGALQVGFNLV